MSKQFVENQLSIFVAVGPATQADEAMCVHRYIQGHKALSALMTHNGMTLFGVYDEINEMRYQPIELCEWEGNDGVDGNDVVYNVCFHSTLPFTAEQALKLRDLVMKAYQPVCAAQARYVRAELTEKWVETLTKPFEI